MRVFLTGLVLLTMGIGTSAFAYPEFGDEVTFVGNSKTAKGQQNKIGLSWKVTPFERFTPDLDSLPVLSTSINGAARNQSEKYVVRGKMWTPEKVRHQLRYCVSTGGKLEQVQTLAGSFKACRVTTQRKGQKAAYWIADVPFGIVRIEGSNGSGRRTSLILASMTSGRRSPAALATGK